ncbi:alanyl-tRNA editing protein [Acanthopleuribacter pedis]|uniref:Alanyl-transfer RNA synthetases family profile domain-containing protein n=1 Tax=Acanthopleuribacter pedis TaxID=442870 RepID=A0A8J7Q1C9_9BACT|nr:DHHA1 domain-containing protein [Acanthopleuribacter pedis]MBO1317244.1 hypothetical protein [Acanthopleuribacter pedis]MBO1318551.1 hypothetical protein [Acanthopleuribacter pedis]
MAHFCEPCYLDPTADWRQPFETRVAGLEPFADRPALQFDRTFFYPEGGGQLGDAGTVRFGAEERTVVDTQIDDNGTLYHILNEAAPADWLGQTLSAQVNAEHRRDMMRAHSGQHLLSAAFHHTAGLETKSARLGKRTISIDLEAPDVNEKSIAAAVEQANRWVLANHPIRVHNPDPDQLAAMPLRRPPKVTGNIRVLEIDSVDFTPCGGTHCSATGEIGAIHVVAKEKIKKLVRIHFHCGLRTLAHLDQREAILTAASNHLQCAVPELADQVQRLQQESRALRQELGKARTEAARYEAEQLHQTQPAREGETTFIRVESADIDSARKLADLLTARPDVVAMVKTKVADDGFCRIVVARGSQAEFDAGAWFRGEGKSLGARGGGRPQKAEGKIPETVAVDNLAK